MIPIPDPTKGSLSDESLERRSSKNVMLSRNTRRDYQQSGLDDVVVQSPIAETQSWFGLGKIPTKIWKTLSLCAYPILLETASGIDAQAFDVTMDACERLCQVFDTTSDGQVTRNELILGLESKGFSSLKSCNAFHELFDVIEELNQGMHTVTPEQLSWILQRIKLEKLLASVDFDLTSYDHNCECKGSGQLHSFIYNAKESISTDVISDGQLRQFFLCDEHHTQSLKSTGSVHWISFDDVAGLDGDLSRCSVAQKNRRIILLLCLRFRLHPLSLERVLNLHTERPKRYVFGRFDFLILPIYRLTKRSKRSVSLYTSRKHSKDTKLKSVALLDPPFIEIEECQVAIWNDHLRWNEFIHIQSRWGLADLRIHEKALELQQERSSFEAEHRDPMFVEVINQLVTTYSVIRRGNSDWLQFAILEAISQDLAVVVEGLRSLIDFHQNLLHAQEFQYATNNIKMIIALNDDLENLKRKLRPLRRIVRSLADDGERSSSIRRYLTDCDEEINNALLDIEQMSIQCESLKNEIRTYKDTRNNDVLFILTMVTTLFIPAQFVTGVYGMNFYDVDKQVSSMPELTWKYGYGYFWFVIALVFSITIAIFKKNRMLPSSSKV